MSHWDERYAPDEYVFGTEPNEFLRDHADRIPPGRVLSLGEGEGRNAVFLAERGHTITAIDASPRGLAKARALADARGVDARIDTIVADLTDYEPEVGAYAGVISIFCHLPPPVRTVVHARAIRALAPLAFGTGGPKDLALLYSLDELRADLDGLELEVARELERTVVEGPRHTGRAAVVEVVARKPLQR
jgi:SAM-dependent methyltransferase